MRKNWQLIILSLIGLINIFPLWIITKQAITPEQESLGWPPHLLPKKIDIQNIIMFFKTGEIKNALLISLNVGFMVGLISVFVGGICGWAMARRARIADRLSIFLIIARMFPSIAIAIPLAIIFIKLGLYNNPLGVGLIFSHLLFVLPFAIFIAYSTFKSIPNSLEEQAMIDGCSLLGAFMHITLPLARSGIATIFFISFILSWDEFTYSLLLQITNRNLPPILYYYSSFGSIGISSAISLIMLIPVMIIFIFFHRYISRVYLGGAVKY